MRVSVVATLIISGLGLPENKFIIANTLVEITTFIFSSFKLTKDIVKLLTK